MDARYCSLSRVSFGLKLVGAEAARAAACGRKPALPVWISFAVQLRRRAPTSPPPLVRPPRAAGGASLITTTRPPAAPSAWVTGPVSLACHSAASAGPECCVHRIASSGRLRRPRGYRTVRSQAATSAGPECCVHRIASSGRLRRPRGYRTVRSQDTLLRVPGPLGSPGFQVGRPPGPPAVSGTSRPVSRTRAPVAGPRPCSPWQVWCRRGRKPGCSCSTRTAWARTGPGGRTRTGIARRARTTGRLALAATSVPGLARVWR